MADLTQEEIDVLLDAAADEEQVSDEQGAPVDPEALASRAAGERVVKPFDFSKPYTVSRAFERTIRSICENFAKAASLALTNHVRSNVVVTFNGLKLSSFGEAFAALENPSCICVATMPPLKGVVLVTLDAGIMFSLFTKLLGGPVEEPRHVRDFTPIETSMARKLVERILANLKGAAERVVALEPQLVQIENNPHYLNVLSDGETVLTLDCGLSLEEVPGSLRFCMPLAAFEPVRQLFDPKEAIELRSPAEKARDRGRVSQVLQEARATLSVRFAPRKMPLRRLLALSEGDELTLGHAVSAPLIVYLEERPMFEGVPGRVSQRRALRILRRTKET